jgi:hypothetical protein
MRILHAIASRYLQPIVDELTPGRENGDRSEASRSRLTSFFQELLVQQESIDQITC